MNYWTTPGIPHKGWSLIDVEDIRDEGQPEWETNYETCMMCGNEKIRFVHIVEHPEVKEDFRVGCICAGRMTDDYITPERREVELRNRASRRANWSNKQWKCSKKGNYYLKKDDHHLTIFQDKKTTKFKCIVDDEFGTLSYNDLRLAKVALFNKIEDMKKKGQW